MNKELYWVKILNYYTNKGIFSNGLTLPFLIGCSYINSKKQNVFSISEIISDFARYEMPITLMKCPQINEYIFNIMDSESLKHKSFYREINNIYTTDNSLNEIKNTNELKLFFEDRYRSLNILNENRFSRDNNAPNKWREFDSKEENTIKEILFQGSQKHSSKF
ncbi:hypothetical protein NU10_10295 [Flavobacterium dauae]|uniref:hypothetical protein n=1 Tax=Flavobacterium dauae TaxID=1563479 RepID=UPI00101B2246|nr:hypothetical protein [Flavobacterium dauae]WLD23095.1 hypothetical protein NU10_10295 [Flavobacterium dauae]